MRLGELRNKLRRSLNEENQLVIYNEPIFGGQGQRISKYNDLMEALSLLKDLSWNNVNDDHIAHLEEDFTPHLHETEMIQADFNHLNTYIASVNQQLPIFMSMLDSFVSEQEEHLVNIKLPEKIKSLSDLTKFNQSLEQMFKKFNFSGEFEFRGLDKGTSWYEILITSAILYRYFVACLSVAYDILKLKKEYYKSQEARLNYLSSLRINEKENEEEQKKHSDKFIDVSLRDKVEKVVEEIAERNGKSEQEAISGLVIATTELVKQLDDGVEFHLSLNPPEYAEESRMGLRIDYSKIKKIEKKILKKNLPDSEKK